MSEDLVPARQSEEHIGEVALGHDPNIANLAEDSHDTVRQYAKEIHEAALGLLDEADGFRGKGPQGWEEGHNAPSHIGGEFVHNVHRRKLDGIGLSTELFTERLRIQETNVVAPYEKIEGGAIRVELLEIPEDAPIHSYGGDGEHIDGVTRLSARISPNGDMQIDTYAKGDGRLLGDIVEGPGVFGHGNSQTAERLDFTEADAQRVLALFSGARADVRYGVQLQEQPDTIVDPNKAHDMALVGKPDRDIAVGKRVEAKGFNPLIEALPGAIAEIKEPAEKVVELAHEGRFDPDVQGEKDALVEKVDELIESKDPKIRDALKTLVVRLYRGGYDFDTVADYAQRELEDMRDDMIENAKEHDNAAERREYWAGVLHDNPISEAYKERYGIETVTPEILVRLENEVDDLEARLITYTMDLDRSRNGGSYANMNRQTLEKNVGMITDFHVTGRDFEMGDDIARLAYTPGSEEYGKYMQAVASVSSKERNAAHNAAVEQAIKNMTITVKLKQTFLDDIRTGRASMWQ